MTKQRLTVANEFKTLAICGGIILGLAAGFQALGFKTASQARSEVQPKLEQPEKFEVTRQSVAMLALDCEQQVIRPLLKDPNSFRKLDHTYKETTDLIYVQVNYTATNSFGGRVQNSKVCKFSL